MAPKDAPTSEVVGAAYPAAGLDGFSLVTASGTTYRYQCEFSL
jgi:hypothetical protein